MATFILAVLMGIGIALCYVTWPAATLVALAIIGYVFILWHMYTIAEKVLSSLAHVKRFLGTSLHNIINRIVADEPEHDYIYSEHAAKVRLTTHLTQDEPLLRYTPNRRKIEEERRT